MIVTYEPFLVLLSIGVAIVGSLTALALTRALFRRHALSGAALGVGAATKVYPVLLLPVLIAVAARQRGIRTAVVATASALAAAVAVFLPFLIVAPSGTSATAWAAEEKTLSTQQTIASAARFVFLFARRMGWMVASKGVCVATGRSIPRLR